MLVLQKNGAQLAVPEAVTQAVGVSGVTGDTQVLNKGKEEARMRDHGDGALWPCQQPVGKLLSSRLHTHAAVYSKDHSVTDNDVTDLVNK